MKNSPKDIVLMNVVYGLLVVVGIVVFVVLKGVYDMKNEKSLYEYFKEKRK